MVSRITCCLRVDRVAINNRAIQPKYFNGHNVLSVASSIALEDVCLIKHM